MSSPTSPALIPSPWNEILAQKHSQTAGAMRYALTPLCDPLTKEPFLTKAQIRRQLRFIIIDVTVAGDNIIIPASAGDKQIYEVSLWNVGQQTLIWQQGITTAAPVRLERLTSFPALTGKILGFNGSFEQPHWEIDSNQPLVLVLGANTQVDGFVRYRVSNGTT